MNEVIRLILSLGKLAAVVVITTTVASYTFFVCRAIWRFVVGP